MSTLVGGLVCRTPWIDLHLAVSFLDGRTTLSYGHVTEKECREYPKIRSRNWTLRVTSGGASYYVQNLSLRIPSARVEAYVDLTHHRPWAGRFTAHQAVLLAKRLRERGTRALSPDRIWWVAVSDARIERA